MYDPTVGRWSTEDPIWPEGGINPDVYVGNNPTNEVDPEGTGAPRGHAPTGEPKSTVEERAEEHRQEEKKRAEEHRQEEKKRQIEATASFSFNVNTSTGTPQAVAKVVDSETSYSVKTDIKFTPPGAFACNLMSGTLGGLAAVVFGPVNLGTAGETDLFIKTDKTGTYEVTIELEVTGTGTGKFFATGGKTGFGFAPNWAVFPTMTVDGTAGIKTGGQGGITANFSKRYLIQLKGRLVSGERTQVLGVNPGASGIVGTVGSLDISIQMRVIDVMRPKLALLHRIGNSV